MSSVKLGNDAQVTEIVFNKSDPNILTVLGPQTFRYFQLSEGNLTLIRANILGLPKDNTRVYSFFISELIYEGFYNTYLA